MTGEADMIEVTTHTGARILRKDYLARMSDREIVEMILGIDTRDDPDPLIDLPMIALLAGVSRGTPEQWRVRTRLAAGTAQPVRVPFPETPPGIGSRFPDKPMWHAVSQIVPYLRHTRRWPPGRAGRPSRRHPRLQRAGALAA